MNALPPQFTVRLTMHSDWHIGTGAGRPGNIDRLVQRDEDGLPFVPAKTLKGIWRDACELLARALDAGRTAADGQPSWSAWVDFLFGNQPAHPDAPKSATPVAARLLVRRARMAASLREQMRRLQDAIGDRITQLEGESTTDVASEDLKRRRLIDIKELLPAVRSAYTFIKPGVKIDPRTGRAQDDHLRMEEMARDGAVLDATCELSLNTFSTALSDDQKAAARALLVASTRLVERLGGKRRRGAGECSFDIVGQPVDDAIAWLESQSQAPKLPDNHEKPNNAIPTSDVVSNDWIHVPFVIELESPLAVTAQTVGNVIEMHDFLPGTLLLPHVTRRLRERCVNIQPAVQRGDFCVLHATLEINGRRGEPVPFCLFEPKGRGDFQPSRLVNRLVKPEEPNTQLEQCRSGYLVSKAANPALYEIAYARVPKDTCTHNTVDDARQRPTTRVGGVYSYEAIPHFDGENPVRMRGELRMKHDLFEFLSNTVPDWQDTVAGETRLGRSSKDDYGQVRLRFETPTAPHIGGPSEKAGQQGQKYLFVRLLADVLIRNERLRYEASVECLRRELTARLGCVDTDDVQHLIAEPFEDDGEFLPHAVRCRRIDSWHTKWVRPRPSLVGLQAGSCVVFRVDSNLTLDCAKLREIESSGLGERTAEGFGQVRFNDVMLTNAMKGSQLWPACETACDASAADSNAAEQSPPSDQGTTGIPPDDPAYEFASIVEREAWRALIRRAVLRVASHHDERTATLGWVNIEGNEATPKSKPSLSQLGGLRSVIQQLRSAAAADRKRVSDWLEALAANPRRADNWRTDNSPEPAAIQRIRELVGKPDEPPPEKIWSIMGIESWPTLTLDGVNRLKRDLWAEAVRMLILSCHQAQKRDSEPRKTKPIDQVPAEATDGA